MSKALRYLSKTRPEAATNLMGFYKHSVQALDEKTRFLIQIVTKITVGTERGLRQYAPKALKAGASKEEILDAAMMAFPAAGLNKLLDAINILNDLNLLPEVEDEAGSAPKVNKDLGPLDLFPEKRMQCLKRPDGDLLVYRSGPEKVAVYSAKCPHSKATLCEGTDQGDKVECRVHNWVFDLESGKCIDPSEQGGKRDLIVVPVAIVDGHIMLQ
ncbi:MAG: Rieske 2Fe-2S domain-containing protein [Magnetococcales bacterium]|nr:Rieske 2Fe-2S domain-containing protein [Magnetococcales bacterium]